MGHAKKYMNTWVKLLTKVDRKLARNEETVRSRKDARKKELSEAYDIYCKYTHRGICD